MANQPIIRYLGEDKLDGRLEGLGDGDHDVGAEDPEDVVEEEPAQQDAASHHVVQVQQLNAIHSECQACNGAKIRDLHSVPDPDPYVVGPPGSGSIIYLYGSFHQQAKY